MSVNQETSANNLPALPSLKQEDRTATELPALAAGLVHEVKNPLAAIHLHLQLLQNYISEVEDPDLREKLLNKTAFIKSQILGLNSILHDFLSAVKAGVSQRGFPETGKGKEFPESGSVRITDQRDLNAELHIIADLLGPQAVRNDAEIRFLAGAGVREASLKMTYDHTFIRQIAVNLILNAIQAHQSEGADYKEKYIEIITGVTEPEPGYPEGRLFFTVADNGPGITEQETEKLFDPFYTTKENGSGLGLALVKKMISEMHGKVEVHSEPGKGSEFTVIFGELPEADHK